jgi:predicted nucleic acid-binding protein
MSVLIDTSIWSLGLRRKRRDLSATELHTYHAWEDLLKQGEGAIIGPIRQETLSGIAVQREFLAIQARLAVIDDLPLSTDDFVLAATFFNTCRAAGVTPGTIEMIICAAAYTYGLPIFTTDPDFGFCQTHLPIQLYVI